MNDVQLEHGHIRIANRLYEAILDADFSKAQMRILIALIRLTYGWRKKTVMLALIDLVRFTRLSPSAARRDTKHEGEISGGFKAALKELTDNGVVLCMRGGGALRSTYAIQKDFSRWGKFAVAPARLEALWKNRPDSDDQTFEPDEGVGRVEPTPPQDDAQGVGPQQPPGLAPESPRGWPQGANPTAPKCDTPPQLRARKDRKDRKDRTTTREVRVKNTLTSLEPRPSEGTDASTTAAESNNAVPASPPQSAEAKRRSKSGPVKPAKPPQWPHFPELDCHAIYETWTDRRGAVNYGQLRNAFGPLYPATGPRYQLTQLVEAIEVFAELAEADRPEFSSRWNVRTFAADVPRWVRLGAMPHVDEWGIPTERGRSTKLFGEAS